MDEGTLYKPEHYAEQFLKNMSHWEQPMHSVM